MFQLKEIQTIYKKHTNKQYIFNASYLALTDMLNAFLNSSLSKMQGINESDER